MKKIKIFDGITIIYDETQIDELNKILDFSNTHEFLIKNLKDIQLNINEFNVLIKNIVTEFIKFEEIRQIIDDADFYSFSYISYLTLKSNKEKNCAVELPKNMTMEFLQFLVLIKYYDYDVGKVVENLLLNSEEVYDKIFNVIKEIYRINIYNYCLKYTSIFLEEYDSSMLDNLESVITKLKEKNFEYINTQKIRVDRIENLKKIKKNEFDALFQLFLEYITAPKEWYKFYENLKINNLISYEYSKDIDNGKCYLDDNDNKLKIKLISDGTIRTFIGFVHEFIHYVSLIQNDNSSIEYSLMEFPSIYFENIAAIFLKNQGYSEKITEEVVNERNKSNFKLYGSQMLQFEDILSYKKNGPLQMETKIEFYRNWKELANKLKIKMSKDEDNRIVDLPNFFYKLVKKTPEEIVYSEIDSKIDNFVYSGLLINSYQYLIGSFLASYILELDNRSDINKKMINITNKLQNYTISNLIQLFDINLTQDNDKAIKHNIKRLNN